MYYVNTNKKKLVNSVNMLLTKKISIDFATSDSYAFMLFDKEGKKITLSSSDSYYIVGDANLDISDTPVFFSNTYTIANDVITFDINTYNNSFLSKVKVNDTQVYVEIAKKSTGDSLYQVLLRDNILAYPRVYVDGLPPADLASYYTKSEIDTLLDGVVAGDVDLTNYYNKAEADAKTNEIYTKSAISFSNSTFSDVSSTSISLSCYVEDSYNSYITANSSKLEIYTDKSLSVINTKNGTSSIEIDDDFEINSANSLTLSAFAGSVTISSYNNPLNLNAYGSSIAMMATAADGISFANGSLSISFKNNSIYLNNAAINTANGLLKLNANAKIESSFYDVDLTNYYNKSEIDTLLDDVVAGDVDLTNYYTKTEADTTFVTALDATASISNVKIFVGTQAEWDNYTQVTGINYIVYIKEA